VRISAPAKINPFLAVGPRRADGLHELVSVMQSVSLADEVELAPGPGLRVEVEPEGVAPVDATNLAARAAATLASLNGRDATVVIRIAKRIPVAGGLGGGSADAAAALWGLRELWGLAVSKKALERVAASIGADVPFCVRGGAAVARGAGEDLAPLACPKPFWWVLGIGREGLSTAGVYAEFDRLGGREAFAEADPFEVADALARTDVGRLAAALRNDLEPAALSLAPGLERGRDALGGAAAVLLAGSGPTWLGLARDEEHARTVARDAESAFARVEVVQTTAHGPQIVG